VQQCTGATRQVLEPLAEGEGEVAGLLHGPFAGGVRGDAAEVHPAGAVLDEHQDVQPFQQHGVNVQEVDCENPGGLGVQELPVLVENSGTGADLGFHAVCRYSRYSLISPASLVRRWIREAGTGKAMTSRLSSGARSSMPSPWWLRPVL